ncbi:MAG: spore coat protein CotH [Bacilli bacterium]|nr:spore coat protein CotH [Bacilli bacterium]
MKNKTIILLLSVALIIFSFFMNDYQEKNTHHRYQEHLEKETMYPNYNYQSINASTYQTKNITEQNISSHLPILSFETKEAIHGANDKEDNIYVNASLKVYDEATQKNRMTTETYSTESLIRYRGNSSRFFEKKGLRIKLTDEKGKDNDYPLLGLSKDHDFVLHNPYLDKTLLRNYLGYNLTGEVMEYSPNVRFCEVFINHEYQGVYLLVETIKVSQNRVNISELNKNAKVTSYILEINHRYSYEEDNIYLNNFTNYTNRMKTNSAYKIKYPSAKNLTQDIKQYIEKDVNEFERKIYSYDYDNEKKGYYKDIDIDSFVNYVVMNEFFLNYDAGFNSTYLYKDKTGKFKIAFWDMNNIFNNYFADVLDGQDFNFQNRPWFQMLLKDEYFTERVIKRYRELRQTILNEEYLYHYIDDTINYLGEAIERNYIRWGDSFTDEKNLYINPERNIHSYKEAIDQIKNVIHERGIWLDKNIDSLKQFSHESKVKEMNP